VVDLFDQAIIHGGQNLVDLVFAPFLDLFVVLGDEVSGCVIKRQCVEVVSDPEGGYDILNLVLVVLIDGLQIQVWRPASIDCLAVLVDLDKLEATVWPFEFDVPLLSRTLWSIIKRTQGSIPSSFGSTSTAPCLSLLR